MIDSLNALVDFFNAGLYDFLVEFTAWLTIKITIWWFAIKIASIAFFWDVSSQILDQLNISGLINDAWSGIDSTTLSVLTYFRLPEALSIIMNAHITKFVMNLWA